MSKNSIVTQKKPPVQPRAPLLILKHKEIEAKQVKHSWNGPSPNKMLL